MLYSNRYSDYHHPQSNPPRHSGEDPNLHNTRPFRIWPKRSSGYASYFNLLFQNSPIFISQYSKVFLHCQISVLTFFCQLLLYKGCGITLNTRVWSVSTKIKFSPNILQWTCSNCKDTIPKFLQCIAVYS